MCGCGCFNRCSNGCGSNNGCCNRSCGCSRCTWNQGSNGCSRCNTPFWNGYQAGYRVGFDAGFEAASHRSCGNTSNSCGCEEITRDCARPACSACSAGSQVNSNCGC